jgi:hypothetical protein
MELGTLIDTALAAGDFNPTVTISLKTFIDIARQAGMVPLGEEEAA